MCRYVLLLAGFLAFITTTVRLESGWRKKYTVSNTKRLRSGQRIVPGILFYHTNKTFLQPAKQQPVSTKTETTKRVMHSKPVTVQAKSTTHDVMQNSNKSKLQVYASIRTKPSTHGPVVKLSKTHRARSCASNSSYYTGLGKSSDSPDLLHVLSQTITTLNGVRTKSQGVLPTSQLAKPICRSSSGELLVVIFSSLTDFAQRSKIRQSWASVKYYWPLIGSNHSHIRPNRVEHLFIVSFSRDGIVNLSGQLRKLNDELDTEQDVLPIQLTAKQKSSTAMHLIASDFVLRKCGKSVRHVLFLNQTLIPNLPLLLTFITADVLKKNSLHCFLIEKAVPLRLPRKNKKIAALKGSTSVIVTKREWPENVYPAHCNLAEGGFVISIDGLRKWHTCSRVYRHFKLDSIYLTGILRLSADLSINPYWATHGRPMALLPSTSVTLKRDQPLFLTDTRTQPHWVWMDAFRAILRESLR